MEDKCRVWKYLERVQVGMDCWNCISCMFLSLPNLQLLSVCGDWQFWSFGYKDTNAKNTNAHPCSPHALSSCPTLYLLQNVFGNATEGFRLFSSVGYGASDVLFSDATHHLQRVLGSYTSWLGPTYTTLLQAFECEGKNACSTLCVFTHCGCFHYYTFPPTGFCWWKRRKISSTSPLLSVFILPSPHHMHLSVTPSHRLSSILLCFFMSCLLPAF